jgi:DNA primase
MSVVDEVKERIDIVEVIGESVKLRKSGKNFTGFCPFHPNKRTPAFAVFPETGTWRCFGACNEGGDVFSFLMKKESWDFPETLRFLAERAGVELRTHTPAEQAAEEAYQRLRALLEETITFYRHSLMTTSAGEPVLAYLRQRGLTERTLEIFEVGYAPNAWDATLGYLKDKGYSEEELLDAGMTTERDSGGYFDRFRNRIMIPIRDPRGRMAGFGARIVDPEDVPKFLNSPQTVLFDKGRLLYGLDRARKGIRKADQAVIVEGYMDVIGLHQAGYPNAVSPMGTALTESQLRLIKRYSRRMVLALDSDVAGAQATLRGLSIAREALDREPDPVFDARGLVRHEGRIDADIRVITLPEGVDPDEVVGSDPSTWDKMLEGAKTVVDYVLEVLTTDRNVDDPKTKAEVAQQILPLIEDVRNPVERETYRQNLARRLRVDERALMAWRPKARRRRAQTREVEESRGQMLTGRVESPIERFCIAVLLRDPELLYRIDRNLQELGLGRLSVQDFSGTLHQILFKSIRSALSQEELEPVDHWQGNLDESLLPTTESYLLDVADFDFSQPRVLEEVLANFLRLRKRTLELALTSLRFQMQAAQDGEAFVEEGQEDVWQHTREVQRLATQRERLDRALAGQKISSSG